MSGHLSIGSVLKNNRNLLRKKKPYLNTIKKRLKSVEGKLEFKKLSKQEQQLFKENFIKEQKANNRKLIYRSIIVIIPVFIFLFYLYNNIYESNNQRLYNKHLQKQKAEQIISNNTLIEKQARYKSTIENGDIWFEKENWNNAIFLYKNAVEIFPENFDANYRLALAYSYNCKFKNIDCEKGYKLNNRLLKYFPNNLNLQELKKKFDKKTEE